MSHPVRFLLLSSLLLLPAVLTAQTSPEPVRFSAGDVELAGDLYLPAPSGAPAPAVVLLHGSGPDARRNGIFVGLAHFFTAQGFAVLAFDKRGVGESGGTYLESPLLENAAADGLAAVRYLAARDDIDRETIGVWGISQGGWVGPLMAATSNDVAFVIAVSGPGVSPMEQTLYQREAELIESGWPAADAAEATAMRRALWHYAATGEAGDAARTAIAHAETRPWFARLEERPRAGGPEHVPPQAAAWLRHAQYDPVPVLERLRVPVLALFGAKDRHIPVEASMVAMRDAFARGGVDATIVLFDEAGHGMQRVDGPAESLLGMRERHAAMAAGGAHPTMPAQVEDYLATISRWLAAERLLP